MTSAERLAGLGLLAFVCAMLMPLLPYVEIDAIDALRPFVVVALFLAAGWLLAAGAGRSALSHRGIRTAQWSAWLLGFATGAIILWGSFFSEPGDLLTGFVLLPLIPLFAVACIVVFMVITRRSRPKVRD